MNQSQIAELFNVKNPSISKHFSNIYEEGELNRESTVSKMETVQNDGRQTATRTKIFYNLNAMIAMADDRLKQAEQWDYFDKWLERIRDIRASEKRFYQKIRDIYATAVDYDKNSIQAQEFLKKVQNKMLWAITGKLINTSLQETVE